MCYVRPKLEYSTCVWNPYLKKDILLHESVKKKFTGYICIRCNIVFASYLDRLHILGTGIKSLEYRRVEFDHILMYKICYYLSDFNDYFVFRDTGYNLRHHSFSIQTLQQCKHQGVEPNQNVNRKPILTASFH